MKITVHPMLNAQREILGLPQSDRRRATLQMLAPFDLVVKTMVPPSTDPIDMFGLMRPDGPVEAYRDALDRLESAGAEQICRQALQRSVEAIADIGYAPPIDEIHFGLFLLETNPMMAALTQGYTGFGGLPGYIMVNLWPDDRNVPKLGACVAHEFNHQIRLTAEPWRMDISVAEYIVMEGLAESFAAELYGRDSVGPWVSEVQGHDLEKARRIIGQALEVRGFNAVRPYIFGDGVMTAVGAQAMGVPTHAGYAMGYHLVQAYLGRTGKTAAEATLVPTEEIVRVADYL